MTGPTSGPDIVIVDYGLGNIRSIANAIAYVGGRAIVSGDPARIAAAEGLILPGVGAFPKGMENLGWRELTGPVCDFAASGRPLLGICLGMQMLMERGFEHRETAGLGLIPGEVLRLPTDGGSRLPHIGWTGLIEPQPGRWAGTLLDRAHDRNFYFVHSYAALPADDAHVLARASHGGREFAACVESGAIMGTQFHPEKSGDAGLALLRRFLTRCSSRAAPAPRAVAAR